MPTGHAAGGLVDLSREPSFKGCTIRSPDYSLPSFFGYDTGNHSEEFMETFCDQKSGLSPTVGKKRCEFIDQYLLPMLTRVYPCAACLDKYMWRYLTGLFTAIIGSFIISSSYSLEYENYAIICVQKQLNILGHDAGEVDALLNEQTIAANLRYIEYMKSNSPGWGMPGLTETNADFWCEKVGETDQRAAVYWREFVTETSGDSPKSDPASDAEDTELLPVGHKVSFGQWLMRVSRRDEKRVCQVLTNPTESTGDDETRKTQLTVFYPLVTPTLIQIYFNEELENALHTASIDGVVYPMFPPDKNREFLIVYSRDQESKITENSVRLAGQAMERGLSRGSELVTTATLKSGEVLIERYSLKEFSSAANAAKQACPN